MPYLTINQQQLFYDHQPGPTNGPTLVLVHGVGGQHIIWPAEVRSLPDTTVYAIDLPGHGQSDKPGRTTVEAYAGDVRAFIEALELDHVVLAGHSLGGAIAQTLALDHTPQVTGLVLVATSARLRVGEIILENILGDTAKAIDAVMKYTWPSDAHQDLVDLSWRLMTEASPEVLYNDFLACHHFDVVGQLGAIRLPTLVLSGTADRMTPAKVGRLLAEEIPGAQYTALEGAGHLLMQEQPDQVAAAIQEFLVTNKDELMRN